nr:hypothetical protein [Tanacetum cinerariifolium]
CKPLAALTTKSLTTITLGGELLVFRDGLRVMCLIMGNLGLVTIGLTCLGRVTLNLGTVVLTGLIAVIGFRLSSWNRRLNMLSRMPRRFHLLNGLNKTRNNLWCLGLRFILRIRDSVLNDRCGRSICVRHVLVRLSRTKLNIKSRMVSLNSSGGNIKNKSSLGGINVPLYGGGTA